MSRFGRIIRAVALAATLALGANAQTAPSALAQLGPEGATVAETGGSVLVSVPLSRSVPWRVGAEDGPPRIVVEFGDLVWPELPSVTSPSILEVRVDRLRPGWSQLSLVLREPLMVSTAEMTEADDGTALLEVRLLPTIGETFRHHAGPDAQIFAGAGLEGVDTVVIDPGHGGIDPGAIAGNLVEADLTLKIARRLKEDLIRTGRFDAILTRDEDVFVSLETRLTRARAAGAAVFISLHADMLESEDGSASGLTVYRLAEDGADAADRRLAERHAASDLLSGVDLTGAGEDVAMALMELARRDTEPRTRALQHMLVQSFHSAGLETNSRPERQAAFAVLKSAEIPSVLIELGFLSSDEDRDRLVSEEWQTEASLALVDALLIWQDEDRLRRDAMGQ